MVLPRGATLVEGVREARGASAKGSEKWSNVQKRTGKAGRGKEGPDPKNLPTEDLWGKKRKPERGVRPPNGGPSPRPEKRGTV